MESFCNMCLVYICNHRYGVCSYSSICICNALVYISYSLVYRSSIRIVFYSICTLGKGKEYCHMHSILYICIHHDWHSKYKHLCHIYDCSVKAFDCSHRNICTCHQLLGICILAAGAYRKRHLAPSITEAFEPFFITEVTTRAFTLQAKFISTLFACTTLACAIM